MIRRNVYNRLILKLYDIKDIKNVFTNISYDSNNHTFLETHKIWENVSCANIIKKKNVKRISSI